ncbi:MAG: hypothetical protein K2X93_00765 [Candidatus Obscuribacterales bacterium]|nr:hypothetical protein [Candidatus Obscuribacterales bacterium]
MGRRSTRSHCLVVLLTISLNFVCETAGAEQDTEGDQDLVSSEQKEKHPTSNSPTHGQSASPASHRASRSTDASHPAHHDPSSSPSLNSEHRDPTSSQSSHHSTSSPDSSHPGYHDPSSAPSSHHASNSTDASHPAHHDPSAPVSSHFHEGGAVGHAEHKHHPANLLNELNHHSLAEGRAHEHNIENDALVHPGPCLTMRTQLLDQVNQAEKRGVGVWTYRDEFKRLNQLVDEGLPEEKIKKRIMAIVTSLHEQIRTSQAMKNAAILKARRGRTLTKESLLIGR